MAVTEAFELDGVTVGASELSILSGTTSLQNNTTAGIYQLWVDPQTMAKGDIFDITIYEKVLSGGTKRSVMRQRLQGAQGQPLVFPPVPLLNGWDMTIQKISGTDRAFDASVRAVTGSALTEYDTLSAVTVGSSELSILSGTTSLPTTVAAGVFQVFIDVANMAKGDIFLLSVYEKVEATGGAKTVVYRTTLFAAIDAIVFTPPLWLMNGWDVTLAKVSGTDRAFSASVRRVN